MIERRMPDGSNAILLAPDPPLAIAEAAQAERDQAWIAQRISLGRDAALEGEALRRAIQEASDRMA
jgi:hypothetical protein